MGIDIQLLPKKYKEAGSGGVGLSLAKFGGGISGRANLWLGLSLAFLAITLVSFLGLWGYENSLNKKVVGLNEEIQVLNSQRSVDLEKDFSRLKTVIESLEKSLSERVYASRFFAMLEELTLPRVQFSNLQVDFATLEASMDLKAADHETIAKQMLAFEQDQRVAAAKVSSVTIDTDGQSATSLTLKVDQEFLRQGR